MKRIVQETYKRTHKSSSSSCCWKEEKLCLPRLDIKKWYEDPDGFASELRYACHNVGFFGLYHDIPLSVTRRVMKEVGTFFESTPLETKMKMSYEHSPSFRGYMKLGVENTAGQIDHREQIELASETTPPYITTTTTPLPYERLRGNNQWPIVVDDDDPSNNLQMIVEEYIQHMLRLCQNVIQALSYTLTNNNDKHAFDSLFYHPSTNNNTTTNLVHDPFWQCKLASYNYNNIHPTTQQQQGVGEHTDSGFLTLILQNNNNNSGGLQVLYKDEWMDVTTGGDLNVLICNLGEIAQLSTGGYLRATPHRVMMSNHSSSSTRTSIPFFYNPKLNCVVHQSIISSPQQQYDQTDRMRNQSHSTGDTNVILPHYGDNAFKSLARSHPNVFQKHHPDLKILENGQVVYK